MPKPKHIVDGSPEDVEWKRKEAERIANYRANKQKGINNVKQPQKTTLAIQQIVADESIQPRAEIKPEVAREYSEALLAGAELPPLVVFFDGKHYWLSEGFHRRKGYELADVTEVPVEVHEGTKRDAVLHAVGSNATHGLRRTNADKRRAVEMMLKDHEWGQWSDREVGRRCAVNHHLVGEVRAVLTGSSPSENNTGERTFTTKHGTTATMNTSAIGRTSSGGGGGNSSGASAAFGDDSAPNGETDGYGRPVTSATVTSEPDAAQPEGDAPGASDGEDDAPKLTPEERAVALPLYQAMRQYGHVGHLFLSAATAWYQLEEARNKFAFAHSRTVPKHATGTVFDEMQAFLRIPDPEKWEGCAHCKGSMRVGDGEKCGSCKGGFTTHVGEGVSADVVAEFVTKAV